MSNKIEVTIQMGDIEITAVPLDIQVTEERYKQNIRIREAKKARRWRENEKLLSFSENEISSLIDQAREKYSDTYQGQSVVYGVHYSNRVKIGVSTNLVSLMEGYHRLVPEAKLIWYVPGDRKLEKVMHRALEKINIVHLSGLPSEVFELDYDEEVCLNVLRETLVRVLNAE